MLVGKKMRVFCLALVLVFAMSAVAMAVAPNGIYIGASVGKYYTISQFMANVSTAVGEMNEAGLPNVSFVQNGEITAVNKLAAGTSLNDALNPIQPGDLQGTYTKLDGSTFQPNPAENLTVASVNTIAPISVDYGTALANVGLPAEVKITLSNSSAINVPVTWNSGSPAYNGSIAQTYAFLGTLTLPAEVTNPQNLMAQVNVVVAPSALAVTAVDVINETTVRVILNRIPGAVPEVSFFQVNNNTVTAVAAGQYGTDFLLTLGTSLNGTAGTLTVNGVSDDYNFLPDAPVPVSVTCVDYRHMQVTFNTVVDRDSAADPNNYYFDIVEGNAKYGSMLPVIGDSNRLAEIDTEYGDWWSGHITAQNINGRTVVDIYLPEDSRFTNIPDYLHYYEDAPTVQDVIDALNRLVDIHFPGNSLTITDLPEVANNIINNFDWLDDERTILVTQADNNHLIRNMLIPLVKGTNVDVAVRNVRDIDGKRSIDTKVFKMEIKDETAPELVGISVNHDVYEQSNLMARPEVQVHCNHPNKNDNDQIVLTYNEPVFDAHSLGVDEINNSGERNVVVYLDGQIIASTKMGNLDEILSFEMTRYGSYKEACQVVVNPRAAWYSVYNEPFEAGKDFTMKIVGITDLAGNIQANNPVEFDVKIIDFDADDPIQLDPPVVKGIVQIHDNVFRVDWNQPGCTGMFEIQNCDGEDGVFMFPIKSDRSCQSYIYVPAWDIEYPEMEPDKDHCILAYDNNNVLYRTVRVYNVALGKRSGSDFTLNPMTIKKDIFAPKIKNSGISFKDKAAYDKRGTVLRIPVQDRMPWDEGGKQPVYAMIYKYANGRFIDNIKEDVTYDYSQSPGPAFPMPDNADFLPVKVWYEGADGAMRTAIVSNKELREEQNTPGYEDAIWYDQGRQELVINLKFYSQLLDASGKLVPNATYTVEIPKGYFSDPARRDVWIGGFDWDNWNTVLYVDHARAIYNPVVWGYLTTQTNAKFKVGTWSEKPLPEDDAVPQTSKELINYDVDRHEIWVEFTGTIDKATLINPANYKLNNKTLAAYGLTSDDIKYVIDGDRKFAVIILPYDTIAANGDYDFEVYGVANLAGGTMTPVKTQLDIKENTRPVAVSVKVISQHQIELTFDEPLKFKDGANALSAAQNFRVECDGMAFIPTTAALEAAKERVVTLDLPSLQLDTYQNITVRVSEDQNNNILIQDLLGNPLNNDIIYTASIPQQ